MELSELEKLKINDLFDLAKELEIENFNDMSKHDLMFRILAKRTEKDGLIFARGVLEILPDGYGFLRSEATSYLPGPEDIYVSPSQIRRFNLRDGHVVSGQIRPP